MSRGKKIYIDATDPNLTIDDHNVTFDKVHNFTASLLVSINFINYYNKL